MCGGLALSWKRWRAELVGGVDHDLSGERAQLLESCRQQAPRDRDHYDFAELHGLRGPPHGGIGPDLPCELLERRRVSAERELDLTTGSCQLTRNPSSNAPGSDDADIHLVPRAQLTVST